MRKDGLRVKGGQRSKGRRGEGSMERGREDEKEGREGRRTGREEGQGEEGRRCFFFSLPGTRWVGRGGEGRRREGEGKGG